MKKNFIIFLFSNLILFSNCFKTSNVSYNDFKKMYIKIYYIPFSTSTAVPVTKNYLFKRYEYKLNIDTYFICLNKEFKEIINNPKAFTQTNITRLSVEYINYRVYCKVYTDSLFFFKKKIIEFGLGSGKVILNNKIVKNDEDSYFFNAIYSLLPE